MTFYNGLTEYLHKMAKKMVSHKSKIADDTKSAMPKKPREHQRGFTLVELLIAISISGILAAVVAPNLLDWNKNRRVTKDARDFFSNMQRAKLGAIKGDADSVAILNPAARTYQFFLDDGGPTNVGARNGVLDAGERTIIFGQFEPNTTMLVPAAEFAAGPPGFTSRGGALSGTTGTVVFSRTDQAGNVYYWYRANMSPSGHVVFEMSNDSTNGVDGNWNLR